MDKNRKYAFIDILSLKNTYNYEMFGSIIFYPAVRVAEKEEVAD